MSASVSTPKRYTLASVVNLDDADTIRRVVKMNDADISVHVHLYTTRVWVAVPELTYHSDGRGIRYDSFEIVGTRAQVERAVCREVRDLANHRARGGII